MFLTSNSVLFKHTNNVLSLGIVTIKFTFMSKYLHDFNNVAKQLYYEHTFARINKELNDKNVVIINASYCK